MTRNYWGWLTAAGACALGACSGGGSSGVGIQAGEGGLPGQLIVDAIDEPAGANCAQGGVGLASGVDADGSGTLEEGEVDVVRYVCNGPSAGGGGTVSALVEAMALPVGDPNCPEGGTALLIGTDADGDGLLSADEVDDTQYACSGAAGAGAGSDCVFPASWDSTRDACVVATDYAGVDLSGKDVSHTYLAGLSFGGADLSGSDLSWNELRGADFTGANLADANLRFVQANGTSFVNARLDGADLTGADLGGADLQGVEASGLAGCPEDLPGSWDCIGLGANGLTLVGDGASLSGLDLTGADLTGLNIDGFQASGLLGCPAELPADFSCVELGNAGLTIVGPGVDLGGLDLRGADFSAIADLADVRFNGANLEGASFAGGTSFDGVQATGLVTCPDSLPTEWSCLDLPQTGHTLVGPEVDLDAADLTGADLSGQNLDGASLDGALLSGADLTGTQLDSADLGGAVLTGASAAGADFSGADLQEATLTNANLAGADLGNVDLNDATVRGASFDGADLTDASFQDADLTGSSFIGAALDNANFEGAQLGGVTATELTSCPDQLPNDWDCAFDADGTRVLLGPGANVGAAGLDLSGVDLSGAALAGADLSEVVFDGADLSDADLSGSDLSGADVTGADLSGADLTGATLDGATLVGVTWDNTTCPSGVNSDDNGNSCP